MKKLEIRDTKIGRGVFAIEKILAGEIVTSDPVVVLQGDDFDSILKTRLKDYYFEWLDGACIVFGPGSMFNHAYVSSVEYTPDVESSRMHFVAIRDIEAGEEIKINYKRTFYENSWEQ